MASAPDGPPVRRTWDVVLAIVLLVLLIALAAVLIRAGGAALVFSSASPS